MLPLFVSYGGAGGVLAPGLFSKLPAPFSRLLLQYPSPARFRVVSDPDGVRILSAKALLTYEKGTPMTDNAVKERSSNPAQSRRGPEKLAKSSAKFTTGQQVRVLVAAENRLLREALTRVLTKRGGIEVIATKSAAPFHTDAVLDARPDIVLLSSRGSLVEDLAAIH